MPQSEISTWLQFALQQMAAESYLDGIDWNNAEQVKTQLRLGNNRPGFPQTGATRFTGTISNGLQDQAFVERYQIVDHHASDATGFSATLMKDATTNTYTLSFRSLEYQNQVDGGDWQRDGLPGAAGEIVGTGFALAQLVSMERYYRELKANPLKLPPGAILNVTGYSLGGHLATVFTQLHANEIVATYTFNGGGRGGINGGTSGLSETDRIREMLQFAEDQILDWDPTGNVFRDGNGGNIYSEQWYEGVRGQTVFQFRPTSSFLPPGQIGSAPGFEKITQLVGQATHNDQSYVANSGIHGDPTTIFIEDQPNVDGLGGLFGQSGSFGTTHSITLLVDSLALMELFQKVDGTLDQATIEGIFAAASSQTGSGVVGLAGLAEGNSLENALDVLGKILVPNYTPTPSGRQTNDFGNLTFRNQFYTHLQEVKAALNGQTHQIVSLVNMPVETIKGHALLPEEAGTAYRYAVKNLNPFVVVGADYTQFHNPGDLDLYDPSTGNGSITLEYLKDRTAFLGKKIEVNQANTGGSLSLIYYKDNDSGYEIGLSDAPLSQMTFGSAIDETINGSIFWGDRLYGGDGADTIRGEGGNDYIEGNEGNDVLLSGGSGTDSLLGGQGDDLLDGGTGADTLDGGLDNDILKGGEGVDRYIIRALEGADTIEDSDGKGVVGFDGKILLGGLRRTDDPANVFRSPDGTITLTKSGADLVVTGSGPLTIKNFSSGHLGIRLGEEGSYGEATRTEFQKIDHYIQVGNLPDGTPLFEPVYAAFFDDENNDTNNTDPVGRLVQAIGNEHNLIFAGGGNDRVFTGAGDDQVYGEDGDDTLVGLGGGDRLYGGIGNDTLTGDDAASTVSGNDYLDGGEGDDLLLALAGSDFLFGGDGNDYLEGDTLQSLAVGNYGQDYLDGGDGADELHGVGGSDVLVGGAGDDFLLGDAAMSQGGTPEAGGADSLDGGSGEDYLDGQFGEDVLAGGLDDDTLNGGDGSDALYGGDGNDMLSGDLRLLQISGLYNMADHRGAGDSDVLVGGAGSDYLTGGEGADTLVGEDGNDILIGDYDPLRIPFEAMATLLTLGGEDSLEGGEGNDTLKGGVGDDDLDGGIGNDALDGGAGFDSLVGGAGDDVLEGGEGDDLLDGGEGADVLDGGNGDDLIHAGAGNDRLTSGRGNDTLYGEEGNDELISGHESFFETGDSVLVGGAGNDTYVVDNALDTVVEEADAGVDTVRAFVSYALPDHVENLSLSGSGRTAMGNALANELRGSTNSTLDGLGGDDQLLNGRWYRFGHGYDHDTIIENDPSSAPYFPGEVADAVQFTADVTPDQVRWQCQGNDLVLSLDGTSDTLTIPSFYTLAFNRGNYSFSSNIVLPAQTLALGGNPYYVAPSQVERFEFADGTVWGVEAFDATMIGAYHANTYAFGLGDGQDTILDFDFTAEQPADVLQIKAGVSPDDVVLRRVGDDLVLGFEGTTDQLTVQSHFASVFVGFLNFSGRVLNTYQIEQIQFADGTVWDPAAITNQLTDFIGTAAADFFRGNPRANTMQGLGGNDSLQGFGGNDLLDGGAGNDTLEGGDGSDTYLFGRGSGSDRVEDANVSGLDVNTIRISPTVLPTDITLQAATNGDLLLTIIGTSDQLRLDSFLDNSLFQAYQLVFADETIWDSATMLAQATGLTLVGNTQNNELEGSVLNDSLFGLGGNDILWGFEDDDLLAGGVGTDTLRGGEGHDTYQFNLGDGIDTIHDTALPGEGNRIQFGGGITQSDLSFTRDEVARTLTIQVGNSGTDQLRLMNFDPTGANGSLAVQTLAFADGGTMNLADLFPTTVNHAPTLATPLADQTVPEDAPFTIQVPSTTFADEDIGDVLTLSASLADGTALPAWLTFDETTGIFSGTADDAQVGSLDVKVTATDRENVNVSDIFTLMVTNVNEAPTVVSPLADQQAAEDVPFSFVVPTGIFVDIDPGDTLTYSATLTDGSSLPAWLSFNAATQAFAGTPLNSDVSTLNIAVKATDLGDLSVTDTFALAIQNVNDAPTVANPFDDQTVLEGAPFSIQVPGDTFADQDVGDVLSYSATLADGRALPIWLSFNATTQTFTGTPDDAQVGSLDLRVTTTDTGNLSVSDVLTLTVTNVNEAPMVVAPLADQQATQGTVFSLVVPATMFADEDAGDVLTYSATLADGGRLPTWLSFNSVTRTFNGTPQAGDVGAIDVRVTVTDQGNLNVADAFALTIVPSDGTAGNDILIGSSGNDVLDGLGGDDILRGLAGNDTLIGGAGNDLLDGGPWADSMTGGTGSDTYVASTGDTVVEAANAGTDTVLSNANHTLAANVELLVLTGTNAINGTGNSLANGITGNAAANVLDGGASADVLAGLDGNDTYLVDNAGDLVIELANNGIDTLQSSVTFRLGANVENLTLTGTAAINGTGNGSANVMIGNGGANVLSGAGGADTLCGRVGNDRLNGGSGNDTFLFGRGDGQDLVQDNSGTADKLLYDAGINPLDLVISRQASNLRLSIHGSTDHVTIQNWYSSSANRTETIQTGNGQTLLSTQVDQLIQAMAGFTAQTGLTWDQAIDQRPQEVQTVLAASWQ